MNLIRGMESAGENHKTTLEVTVLCPNLQYRAVFGEKCNRCTIQYVLQYISFNYGRSRGGVCEIVLAKLTVLPPRCCVWNFVALKLLN